MRPWTLNLSVRCVSIWSSKISSAVARPVSLHACPLCDKVFGSLQLFATHQLAAHGVRRRVYELVDTPHCLSCMVFFHSRRRVITHLVEKEPVCCAYYLSRIAPLPPDTVAALDAADRVEFLRPIARLARSSSSTGHQACFRLCGPTPAPFTAAASRSRRGRRLFIREEPLPMSEP